MSNPADDARKAIEQAQRQAEADRQRARTDQAQRDYTKNAGSHGADPARDPHLKDG